MEDKSNKFYELFTEFINDKKQIYIPTQQKYEEMVTTIQKRSGEMKEEKNRLTKSEFNLLSRYTLRVEQSKSVLYHGGDPKEKENKPKRVVTQENLFELLHTTHAKLGHGGTGVMWRELQGYFGISKDILAIFLKLCVECELKKSKAKKGIVVKPILSTNQNSRCQVDLIDLQSCPVDGFKHIMVYQDHLTKFVVLRALREKTAFEVVAQLTEIFSTFGCPQILQSDNGREFANRLVNELLRQWPESKIVHGRPRHSQSQGSVERANQDIERILCTFLRDNQSSNWVRALPKVQAMKNRRYHRGIGRSPFEAMFGRKMQLGSEDGNFPSQEERGILAIEEGEDEEEKDDEKTFDWSEAVKNAATGDPNFFPPSDEEEIEEAEEANDLDIRDEQIQEHRAGAREYQEKQAEQMLEASNKRYSQVEVGQSVRIAIDPVDRPKLGHHNLLAVVTDVNEEGQYKMGTKEGTLPQRFSRNQFEPCSSQFLNLEDVPVGETSFRAAVGAESAVGIQGHKHCGCTGDCSNRKCACFKVGRICNSRCHHSNPCKNK